MPYIYIYSIRKVMEYLLDKKLKNYYKDVYNEITSNQYCFLKRISADG